MSQCLYSSAITLFPKWAVKAGHKLSASSVDIIFYYLYGSYRFYRTSVPVQYTNNTNLSLERTDWKNLISCTQQL